MVRCNAAFILISSLFIRPISLLEIFFFLLLFGGRGWELDTIHLNLVGSSGIDDNWVCLTVATDSSSVYFAFVFLFSCCCFFLKCKMREGPVHPFFKNNRHSNTWWVLHDLLKYLRRFFQQLNKIKLALCNANNEQRFVQIHSMERRIDILLGIKILSFLDGKVNVVIGFDQRNVAGYWKWA